MDNYMDIHNLTSVNAADLSIEQLTLLHRGVHRAAKVSDEVDVLKASHSILATTLTDKGVGHGTPLNITHPPLPGVYLKAPHGSLIADDKKRAIAKPHPVVGIEGKCIIVSKENGIGLAFGVATIGPPETVTVADFDKRFEEHRVTHKERAKWWGEEVSLILYPITDFSP